MLEAQTKESNSVVCCSQHSAVQVTMVAMVLTAAVVCYATMAAPVASSDDLRAQVNELSAMLDLSASQLRTTPRN